MSLIICPAYLPNIYYFYLLKKNDKTIWHVHGNYQKQTYRNRTKIYSSNGLFKLYVPVVKPKSKKERISKLKFAMRKIGKNNIGKLLKTLIVLLLILSFINLS